MKKINNLRIGLDIDGVISDFWGIYIKRFGMPKKDSDITRNVMRILSRDKNFWISLPVLNRPDFTPSLYCTKRVIPKRWTKQFLTKNRLPDSPVYQIYGNIGRKSPRIKGRVDVFIDDGVDNFIELNNNGVPCMLLDNEYNRYVNTAGRIYSLQYRHIVEQYNTFIKCEFRDSRKR